jgi:hypothetical protein
MQERLETPAVGDYGSIPHKLMGEHAVIVEPPKNEPYWWAGAPSVTRGADGDFWLACRMRTAEDVRGLRGYELQLHHSKDGIHFDHVKTIPREDVPIPGFERPALVRDPRTGDFKLYACGPWQEGPWGIIKFDDAISPENINPASARPVIMPRAKVYDRDQIPIEYKDPFIFFAEGAFHCYVIGYMRRNERIYHFRSEDGVNWEPVGSPYVSVLPLSGWHDFFIRPGSVVPVGVGYLFFYEGSKTSWYDPVYNVVQGVGFTFDLHNIIDLTPDAPLAISSTPGDFATFRYAHYLNVGEELWCYAEVSRPNNSHEIRLFRLSR